MSTAQEARVRALFARIDDMDVPGMLTHLAPEVAFQFGNNPTVSGRAAVGAVVEGVFAGFVSIGHQFDGLWQWDKVSVCQLVTTYGLKDGRHLSLPAAVILTHGPDGLIADYRIYQDISPLWAAP